MDKEMFLFITNHQQEWAEEYKRQRAVKRLEKNRAEKKRAKEALIHLDILGSDRKIY
jgi:hypothetical protein